MNKLKQNESGFSVVEVVLVLVIVVLLGVVGWFVYKNQKKTTPSTTTTVNTTASTPAKTTTTPVVDPYAGWKSYSRYGVTFKYPSDWGFKANDTSQSSSTALTSPDFAVTVGDFQMLHRKAKEYLSIMVDLQRKT